MTKPIAFCPYEFVTRHLNAHDLLVDSMTGFITGLIIIADGKGAILSRDELALIIGEPAIKACEKVIATGAKEAA